MNKLTNVYDVPATPLIEEVAKDLKENKNIEMPQWAYFVKTGSNRERPPQNEDWWYIRMASILRKVYIKGKVTVKYLRTYYGGKKNRGVKPDKFKKASGKIIRVCLQDLEKLGFIKIPDSGGRVLTKKGQAYLDKKASDLFRKLYKDKKPFLTTPQIKKVKKDTKEKKALKTKAKKEKVKKTEGNEEVKTKSKKTEAKKKIDTTSKKEKPKKSEDKQEVQVETKKEEENKKLNKSEKKE